MSAPDSAGSPVAPGVRRALEALATIASRALSNRAQAPIRFSLAHCEPALLHAVAALAGPHDRAVDLRAATGAGATILVSRPLSYALLALRFGGRGTGAGEALPDRAYSLIEEQVLVRTARELFGALGVSSGGALAGAAATVELVDSADLRARGLEPVTLACFAAEGLGGEARFWIALPRAAQEGGEHEDEKVGALDATGRNAAPRSAARHAASRETEGLSLGRGSRVAVDLTRDGGACLSVDGRVLARGRARFADARVVLEVEETEGDAEPAL